MVWDRSAKLKFYHARRRQAIDTFVSIAEDLGVSKKKAASKAKELVKKEYAARRDSFAKVNKAKKENLKLIRQTKKMQFDTAKFNKLKSKKKKTPGEKRTLASMKKKQAKIRENEKTIKKNRKFMSTEARKADKKWNKFETKIQFVTKGARDEEGITKART